MLNTTCRKRGHSSALLMLISVYRVYIFTHSQLHMFFILTYIYSITNVICLFISHYISYINFCFLFILKFPSFPIFNHCPHAWLIHHLWTIFHFLPSTSFNSFPGNPVVSSSIIHPIDVLGLSILLKHLFCFIYHFSKILPTLCQATYS